MSASDVRIHYTLNVLGLVPIFSSGFIHYCIVMYTPVISKHYNLFRYDGECCPGYIDLKWIQNMQNLKKAATRMYNFGSLPSRSNQPEPLAIILHYTTGEADPHPIRTAWHTILHKADSSSAQSYRSL